MVKLPGLRLSLADIINQKLDGVAIVESGSLSLSYTFPVMKNTYLAITDYLFSGTGAAVTLVSDGNTILDLEVSESLSCSPFTPLILNLEKTNTLTMTADSGDVKANLYGFTYVSAK